MRAALLLLLLAGCATTIDTHKAPPSDWPALKIVEHEVSGWQVQRHCYKYVPLSMRLIGGFALACAEWNFAKRTCTIYRTSDSSPEVLDHEYDHCLGYAHVDDDAPANAWRAYLSRGGK